MVSLQFKHYFYFGLSITRLKYISHATLTHCLVTHQHLLKHITSNDILFKYLHIIFKKVQHLRIAIAEDIRYHQGYH